MQRLMTCLLAVLLTRAAAAALPEPVELEMASEAAAPHLGFGWGQGESSTNRSFRWICRLEADILFDVKAASDLGVSLNAAPMYMTWKRQVIGVYVNGRFVTEWMCPDSPDFQDYSVTVPAALVRPGKNTLTLRLGYRRRVPPDTREVGLAVHRVSIKPQ